MACVLLSLGALQAAAQTDETGAGGEGEDALRGPDVVAPRVAEPAPGEEEYVTRLEARIAFEQLVADERFTEAAAVAERVLELTVAEFGPQSPEAAEAHAALGEARSRAGEYRASEQSYLRAVEILRDEEGMFSAPVIDPLVGLGDNYQRAEQHLNAVSAYNEARTVSRRVFGLLNEGQIEILDRMTESFRSMDEYLQADEQQRDALRLIERSYEPHSPRMLEAIYKYARWLRDTGRFHQEREQYARAVRLIRDHYGENSPRLVEPLKETGNSYRTQRVPESQGIGALEDALEVLEAQEDPQPLAMAEVLRDIGDWEVAFSTAEPDTSAYRRSWQWLGQTDDGVRLRQEWYASLEYVLREPISQRDLSNDADALPGHVLVRFDLDAQGRTENVALVESEPPGLKDDAVLRHVRSSRFRPNLADGRAVRSEGRALQFNFRYLPPDEDG